MIARLLDRFGGPGRRTLVLVLPTIAILVFSAGAYGYYLATSGTGSGGAALAGLNPPTLVTVGPSGVGAVAVRWQIASSAVVPAGYYVTRTNASSVTTAACGSDPTHLIAATSCTDGSGTPGLNTPVPDGTYSYTVTAVSGSWRASATSVTPVTLQTATHFVLAAQDGSPEAGSGDSLTISARDASDATVLGYTGDKTVTFTGAATIGSLHPTVTDETGAAVRFGTAETLAFVNGVATVASGANGRMTLYAAETIQVTVDDGSISGTSTPITVQPASAASFAVQPALTAVSAGQSFAVTVTALDGYGNVATSYSGSRSLDLSGPQGSTGPPVTAPTWAGNAVPELFVSGTALLPTTLVAVETVGLTATDSAQHAIAGTAASITVSAGGASQLLFATQPAAATAGSVFGQQPVLLSADAYGNPSVVGVGVSDVVTIGVASGTGTLTGTTTADIGTGAGDGTVSFSNLEIDAAGANVLGASAASTLGTVDSGTFTVSAGPLASFLVTPSTSTPVAGTPFPVSLAAVDAYANIVTPYTGTQCVTFSGPAATGPSAGTVSYPAPTGACATGSAVTFTAGVATGADAPEVTLVDAQPVTLRVTDGPTAKAGTASLTVGAALPASVTTTTGDGQSALVNAAFATTLEVTVADPYGNPTPGATVTFLAPATAPSATFANATNSTATTTGGDGTAFASTLTADSAPGTYGVTATVSEGAHPSALFTLTNT